MIKVYHTADPEEPDAAPTIAGLPFVKFPVYLFDKWQPLLSLAAWNVLCVIVRKTAGWHKPEDAISYSQIVALSGVKSDRTVTRALRELVKLGLIAVYQPSRRDAAVYRLIIPPEFAPQNLRCSEPQDLRTQKKLSKEPEAGTGATAASVTEPPPTVREVPEQQLGCKRPINYTQADMFSLREDRARSPKKKQRNRELAKVAMWEGE